MILKRCKFVTDVHGVYITPLIGYSWGRGEKSIWIGWLFWLFMIALEEKENE